MYLCPSCAPLLPDQVAKNVVAGIRPDAPALDALPGPDKPSPERYDAYCALMR